MDGAGLARRDRAPLASLRLRAETACPPARPEPFSLDTRPTCPTRRHTPGHPASPYKPRSRLDDFRPRALPGAPARRVLLHALMALPALVYERVPGAAATLPAPQPYRRREPEKTALYTVVRDNLETLLDDARRRSEGGTGYPAFVEKEFRKFLSCGVMSGGFARIRCPACGFERLLPTSCKGRLCPSCWGRRASDTAAWLVDEVLPVAPYRQWVLSFPWETRFLLAFDNEFFSDMTAAFLRVVFAFQRLRGRRLGIRGGQTGAVVARQRFGGVCNLNPHVHVLIPDGLFVPGPQNGPEGAPLSFEPLPPPEDEDIRHLVLRIANRLGTRAIRRMDEVGQRPEWQWPEPEQTILHAAAVEALRSPRPPPAPRMSRRERAGDSADGRDPDDHGDDDLPKPLCDSADGFSLHAATVADADDREGLEALLRYGLRAPFSNERLSIDPDGRVRLRLLRPWPKPGGRTEVVLEPLSLLRRLAVLVPRPFTNLIGYYGVFANRSRFRARLPRPPATLDPTAATPEHAHPPTASKRPPPADAAGRPRRLPWAVLLRRVLDVDALACPKCSTPMVVLAFLTDPAVVRKILEHLGLPADLPAPAPPTCPFNEPVACADPAPDPPFSDDDCPQQTAPTARAPP